MMLQTIFRAGLWQPRLGCGSPSQGPGGASDPAGYSGSRWAGRRRAGHSYRGVPRRGAQSVDRASEIRPSGDVKQLIEKGINANLRPFPGPRRTGRARRKRPVGRSSPRRIHKCWILRRFRSMKCQPHVGWYRGRPGGPREGSNLTRSQPCGSKRFFPQWPVFPQSLHPRNRPSQPILNPLPRSSKRA